MFSVLLTVWKTICEGSGMCQGRPHELLEQTRLDICMISRHNMMIKWPISLGGDICSQSVLLVVDCITVINRLLLKWMVKYQNLHQYQYLHKNLHFAVMIYCQTIFTSTTFPILFSIIHTVVVETVEELLKLHIAASYIYIFHFSLLFPRLQCASVIQMEVQCSAQFCWTALMAAFNQVAFNHKVISSLQLFDEKSAWLQFCLRLFTI